MFLFFPLHWMPWWSLVLILLAFNQHIHLISDSFTSKNSANTPLEVYAKWRDFGICNNKSMRKSTRLIQPLSWVLKESMSTKQEEHHLPLIVSTSIWKSLSNKHNPSNVFNSLCVKSSFCILDVNIVLGKSIYAANCFWRNRIAFLIQHSERLLLNRNLSR